MVYRYPVADEAVDTADANQDSLKWAREHFAVASWIEKLPRDSIFVDYGCGTGRYLPLAAYHNFATICAFDKDGSRLEAAARSLSKDRKGVLYFEHLPDLSSYIRDGSKQVCVLASQVVGHMSSRGLSEFNHFLRDCLDFLTHLAVSAPVCTDKLLSLGIDHEAGADFHHSVRYDAQGARPDRRALSAAEFEALAEAPHTGWLPVRCFNQPGPTAWRGETISGSSPPPRLTFAMLAPSTTTASIYSSHLTDPDGDMIFGDTFISFKFSR